MSEYIEREALKESLKESYKALSDIYSGLKFEDEKSICAGKLATFIEAILRVKDAPAVDVVEVVRCENCEFWGSLDCPMCHKEKYYDEDEGSDYYLVDKAVAPFGFCSYGERREEDATT